MTRTQRAAQTREMVAAIIECRDRGLTHKQTAAALGLRYEAIKSAIWRNKISFAKPATAPVIPAKTCAFCGAALVQKHGEDNHRYGKRTTCGKSCGSYLAARTRAELKAGRPPKTEAPPKPCVICGKDFCIRDTEGPKHFENRKTCGRECATALAIETNKQRHAIGAVEVINWPGLNKPVELPPNAFGAFNIAPPPEYGRPPSRTPNQTLGGVVSYGGRGME